MLDLHKKWSTREGISTYYLTGTCHFALNIGTHNPRGGTCENFDRDARVIFLGLKSMKMSCFSV